MERFILHLGIMSGLAAVVICVVLLARMIFSRLHKEIFESLMAAALFCHGFSMETRKQYQLLE